MKKVILVGGFPGSGKSSYIKNLVNEGYVNLNRDTIGSTEKLMIDYKYHLANGTEKLVLDNTYPTVESRKELIQLAHKYGYKIEAWFMSTSIEDAQVNIATRMYQRYGKLLMPEDIRNSKDPNMFPPAVIFKYKKEYQKPGAIEGFDNIIELKFKRNPYTYTNKAIILDYDGTLRDTISGDKFPVTPDDIKILPNRIETLKKYLAAGYILLGVSNQSGVAKGKLTKEMAVKCFEKTNELLGINIDVRFCPHSIPPIVCYCRKPMPGLGIQFVEEYKLNPADCIMVGDMTTDKTFSQRCGFKFMDQDEFFK